jgi:predicted nucleic acid-binding protein
VKGLLDTSVVIARDVADLPDEAAISAATLAELHFGVLLARDEVARRNRLRRLSEIESRFDPLPIDAPVARSYGMLAHVTVTSGRQPRRRALDLLIAATAHAHEVPLFTRDRADLTVLEGHVDVRLV